MSTFLYVSSILITFVMALVALILSIKHESSGGSNSGGSGNYITTGGNAVLDSLNVKSLNVSGDSTVGGTSTVTGDSTVSGMLNVGGGAAITGGASVSGAAVLGSTLNVTGATTLNQASIKSNGSWSQFSVDTGKGTYYFVGSGTQQGDLYYYPVSGSGSSVYSPS